LFAQVAIITLTIDSSMPLKGVDDWIDRLIAEEKLSEGATMKKLLAVSRRHLMRVYVYELGVGHNDKAKSCSELATLFEALSHRLQISGPQNRAARPRGRQPDVSRRNAIRKEMQKFGTKWRDHLPEIFQALDSEKIPLGDLLDRSIQLDEGRSLRVEKWEDLDLAIGEDRRQIIDSMRKYQRSAKSPRI